MPTPSQHARLLTIQASEASGLSAALSVERFTGTEAVNALFCFDIDALSPSSDLPLESLLGEELSSAMYTSSLRSKKHRFDVIAAFSIAPSAGITCVRAPFP